MVNMEKLFTLPEKVINDILSYLGGQPYMEVAHLIVEVHENARLHKEDPEDDQEDDVLTPES